MAKSEFKGDIEYHAQRFQEGTREWIFKKVDDWLDDRTSQNRVMVISGHAGMGKSVISAVVCKRMQEAGRLSGSHFCQHNNVRYRNPQLMLQSLASHLSRALPEYKEALLEQLSRNLGTEMNNMGVEEQFALLFKEPLSTVSDPGRNILMVIDALDESEYKGRNELLDVIANHFCKLPLWIRFLVTTRPEVNTVDSLKDLQPLQLESNGDDNKRDIWLFFEKRLSQVIPDEDQDMLINKLVERSEGVILYAYFLVDFIEKNVPLLTQKCLDGSLPLGISSVYKSYFKRLEKEVWQELELDEVKFLSFLSAVTAAKEPLPLALISKMFNFRGISSQRKVKKAISCISTLLPVRDGRLHIFHKSVMDWLTDASCYGQHEFIMDQKDGCQVLSNLCETELEGLKQNGIHSTQFSDAEIYALRHGVRHILDAIGDQVNPQKLRGVVDNYVTDLELLYAKFCLGDTAGSDDLLNLRKQEYFKLLPAPVQCAVSTALSVSRKHKPALRRHPQHFFQAILNERGNEYASKALQILQTRYPEIPYIEILNKKDNSKQRRVEARFECDSLVACFDVSLQMEYVVCECVDRSIQLWSLQSGDRRWMRDAFTAKSYGFPLDQNCALRDVGELCIHEGNRIWHPSLCFYRSVVFHPDGEWVLPGSLRDVFTINGDVVRLFPASSCRFTVCAFSGDKTKMLTDCPDNPKIVVKWNMSDGTKIMDFQRKNNLSSFAFSSDGTLVAISDCSQHTGLYKVDNLNSELLCEIASPGICGLMHFHTDGQKLVCGYIDPEWHSGIEISCLNYKFNDTGELVYDMREPDLSWWPWEFKSLDEGSYLFQHSGDEWGKSLSQNVPAFTSGFFSLISEESLLVGSPYSSEVCMVNLGQFKHYLRRIDEVPSEVKLSVDGKYRYVTGVFDYGPWVTNVNNEFEYETKEENDDIPVEVRVFSEEGNVLNTVDQFSHPLFLLPVREGVLVLNNINQLELWDFGLSRCVRTFPKVHSVVELFLVSEELVGCLRTFQDDSNKVDILRIANAEIVLSTPVEDNVTSITCNEKFQFVACSCRKEVPSDENLEMATIAAWTRRQKLWERTISSKKYYAVSPSALIARNDNPVVTWRSFDQGAGVHVLDATTGATLHKLLTDQRIDACKFLSDGKHLVCCGHDGSNVPLCNIINANSDELITFIATHPHAQLSTLTSSLNEPLFAVGLDFPDYQLFRVHFPEVKGREKKSGTNCFHLVEPYQTPTLSILLLLLTNICGLSPPSTGWHSKPPPSYTLLEENVAHITFYRNELNGHGTNTVVELSSRAAMILENTLLKVPFMKHVNDEERKGAIQARFYCSDAVACLKTPSFM
ncbi:hypothetical protein ACROYT_G030987 [Oculina patagonica]